MENEMMQKFNYTDKVVRVISRQGEPWFVGRDVCEALGYKKPENALSAHVDPEDKTATLIQGTGSNYKTNATIVNESGLYSLIMSSKLLSARQFKRWVTSEVLPAVRKHGAYMTPETIEKTLTDPDFIIRLAQELKAEKERRLALETERTVMLPKAEYCDAVLQSPSLIPTNVIAKDYGMSARRFNQMLCNMGVQYKRGGMWAITAKYQGEGYAQSETFCREEDCSTYHWTKWTEKGRNFLYQFLKEHDILPVSEREKKNVHQI